MTDTPEHIKALQLKIWLSKPSMERLRQMMTDNEALMKFWSGTNKKDSTADFEETKNLVKVSDKKITIKSL